MTFKAFRDERNEAVIRSLTEALFGLVDALIDTKLSRCRVYSACEGKGGKNSAALLLTDGAFNIGLLFREAAG